MTGKRDGIGQRLARRRSIPQGDIWREFLTSLTRAIDVVGYRGDRVSALRFRQQSVRFEQPVSGLTVDDAELPRTTAGRND